MTKAHRLGRDVGQVANLPLPWTRQVGNLPSILLAMLALAAGGCAGKSAPKTGGKAPPEHLVKTGDVPAVVDLLNESREELAKRCEVLAAEIKDREKARNEK